MNKKSNNKNIKPNKNGWRILAFVFSVFILGTAIGKKFQLSPMEWVALVFWFVGIGIYKYSTTDK
ncbi:hypothetical protein [Clostridium ganghwense]|uniref:Uncharacterized protein n=1 Tax=Clostridium ganghwense TaxID=312089 RepID=A0ABT4CUH9_9CLOT|nr:hypothetical protein [Clostridium ganghwense]MCY6372728.1 hypothetical protein [Clostridium ganghwense]